MHKTKQQFVKHTTNKFRGSIRKKDQAIYLSLRMTESNEKKKETKKARLLVVGLARPRVAKVMSLLQVLLEDQCQEGVALEYLPCVASFDSYEDEHGKNVRYLISVNYHGPNATEKTGSSLAPFFDEDQELYRKNAKASDEQQETSHAKNTSNLGIIGAAIGVGIEEEADVDRIKAFFQILRGQDRDPLPMKVLEPNPEYATMREETEAFKALDKEAKEEAAKLHTIGPGKMAKFAFDFSRQMIDELLKEKDDIAPDLVPLETNDNTDTPQTEQSTEASLPTVPRVVDPTKTRYACRTCRTVLFGEDDFEDPPHVAQKHQFSARKKNHGGAGGTSCQSHFLTDKGLDWMGDMSEMEGRFSCPKCKSKLGTWHWAGAQCSCGTWVTPAVQIPKSKVDELLPSDGATVLPPGTVVSPHILQALNR